MTRRHCSVCGEVGHDRRNCQMVRRDAPTPPSPPRVPSPPPPSPRQTSNLVISRNVYMSPCWEFYEESTRIFHIPFEYFHRIIGDYIRLGHSIQRDEVGKYNTCPDSVNHRDLLAAQDRESEEIAEEAIRTEKSSDFSTHSDGDCAICFEQVGKFNRVVTPCGHLFCFTCIDNMKSSSCPMCRKQIRTTNKSNIRRVEVGNYVSPDVLFIPANMMISTITLENNKRLYVIDSSKHEYIPKVSEPIVR